MQHMGQVPEEWVTQCPLEGLWLPQCLWSVPLHLLYPSTAWLTHLSDNKEENYREVRTTVSSLEKTAPEKSNLSMNRETRYRRGLGEPGRPVLNAG